MTKLEKLMEKRDILFSDIQAQMEFLWPVGSNVQFVIRNNQKTLSTGVSMGCHGSLATVVVKMDKLSKKEQFRQERTGYGQHTVKRVNWKDMR